jgi:hypothetical protein
MSRVWSSGVSNAPGRRGDDVEIKDGEIDVGGGADGSDAGEAAADHSKRVLCGKQQHMAVRAAGRRRRRGAPEAIATAMSSARERLAALGSPPTMPTAWSARGPSMSHRQSGRCGSRSAPRPTGSRVGSTRLSRRLGSRWRGRKLGTAGALGVLGDSERE